MLSFVSMKGRILDNGCGTGILFEALSCERRQIFGLDISQNMLRYAQKKAEKIVLGDSQELPFRERTFDLILCRSLLHHLPNSIKGIAEMARVLREGGEIILVETNRSVLSYIPRVIAKKGEHFSDDHQNMSSTKLVSLLQRFFRIDRVYHFGYFAYPIGFPDILDIGKYLPFPATITKIFIKIDEWIAKMPLIRTQSWGIMMKGTKKENCND